MRYPGAEWWPGPPQKQGYAGLAVNACKGVICHSAVGSLAGALGELNKPDRRASWHFTIAKDGRVLQHYDTGSVCWHGGTREVNGRYLGIEHEGGPPNNVSEPLTQRQLDASVALVRWLGEVHGFALDRQHLREHNEFYQTACPSGRIPWNAYKEEAMTPEVRAAFTAILQQLGKLGADLDELKKKVEALEK